MRERVKLIPYFAVQKLAEKPKSQTHRHESTDDVQINLFHARTLGLDRVCFVVELQEARAAEIVLGRYHGMPYMLSHDAMCC